MVGHELDELDVALLAELHEHPRISVLELSRRIQVARATVQSRLDRMRDAGVITGFGPDVNLAAAGFGVQAFVTLEIAQGRLHDVAQELEATAGVVQAHVTTGPGDVLCYVAATSNEELQELLLALNRSNSIVRSTSVVVLSEIIKTRVIPLLASQPRSSPSRAPAFSQPEE